MVVNSELEAIACLPVRQPDTDRFRYWESAGTCHVSQQSMDLADAEVPARLRHALPQPASVNGISMIPLYDAALHHVQRVVDERRRATRTAAHRVRRRSARDRRDEHGIAAAASASRRPTCRSPRTAPSPSHRTSSACCTARACRSRPTRSAGCTATSPRTSPASRKRRAPPSRRGAAAPRRDRAHRRGSRQLPGRGSLVNGPRPHATTALPGARRSEADAVLGVLDLVLPRCDRPLGPWAVLRDIHRATLSAPPRSARVVPSAPVPRGA